MDLISYRGPGVAGGVSSGLGSAWRTGSDNKTRWWHVNKNTLQVLSPNDTQAKFIFMLPETLVNGHYRYCNEFLWPIMHDLPQFASYHPEDENSFQVFNRLMAEYIDFESGANQEFFVQDYQLSLLPSWMAMFGHPTAVFWHIPWPRNVKADFVAPIKEVARGLLSASALGFHTQEYADNFAAFVEEHMPEYKVGEDSRFIEQVVPSTMHQREVLGMRRRGAFIMRPDLIPQAQYKSRTRLLVKGLGIDPEHWSTASQKTAGELGIDESLVKLANSQFILSVDRADYTKSVLDRLLIVDQFFERHPDQIGKVTFAQICGRTRPGLDAFDKYWHSCRALWAATNHRWRTDGWEPIKWIDQSLSSQELAYLYNNAEAMLVNPVRDGLNLTAKEYLACQGSDPGVLLLSPGAGAWHELKDSALPAPPKERELSADSVYHSLKMPTSERQKRAQNAKTRLESNTLNDWWQYFSRLSLALHREVAGSREELANATASVSPVESGPTHGLPAQQERKVG